MQNMEVKTAILRKFTGKIKLSITLIPYVGNLQCLSKHCNFLTGLLFDPGLPEQVH